MRRFVILLSVLLALGALGVTARFVLESFRAKGDFAIRPREKTGTKFTVTETLTHGEKSEAVRWSADFTDEIMAVAGGTPTGIRRTFVSYEMDAQGPPAPRPLSAVVLLDSKGARLETNGQPFTTAPFAWPDPFYGVLPDKPVHHSTQWEASYATAVAIASFLARAPATGAKMETRLEQEFELEGIECWRLRSGLEATLEDGRTMKVVGDVFFDRKAGIPFDMQWLGVMEGQKGEEQVQFDRRRRARK